MQLTVAEVPIWFNAQLAKLLKFLRFFGNFGFLYFLFWYHFNVQYDFVNDIKVA